MKSKSVFFAFYARPRYDAAVSSDKKSKLGKVSFPTSCDPKVQAQFERAVAMLHSFWYSAGEKTFRDVLAQDPVMRNRHLGHRLASYVEPARRSRFLAQGCGAGTGCDRTGPQDRCQDRSVSATTSKRSPPITRIGQIALNATGRQSRAKAYEALAARYPDDDEAQIFYALYLAGTQSQAEQTYATYLKSAAILEKAIYQIP